MAIAYKHEASVEYSTLTEVAPNVRRIIARNASPFTYHGTGTYVIGRGKVAVIDPGPLDQAHVDALLRELGDEQITHVLVTHTHNDHSPATRLLKAHCTAPTYAFGKHGEGRYGGGAEIEEGADLGTGRALVDLAGQLFGPLHAGLRSPSRAPAR